MRRGSMFSPMIRCAKCKIEKPSTEFYLREETKTGFCSVCKECQIKNSRRVMRQVRYGVNSSFIDDLFKRQNGQCKICSKSLLREGTSGSITSIANIDHDHETGSVRGLLCAPCNQALGLLKDDFKLFERAAKYLKEKGKIK